MRVLLLWLAVAGLSLYAWRDWYRSLCGLVVLTAVIEHPDMPRALLGIPGLNPWNLVFFSVLLAIGWRREAERLRWDLPRGPAVLLSLGLGLLVAAFARLVADRQSVLRDLSAGDLLSDYLVNPVKWVMLGLLLFVGGRDHHRVLLGLASLLSFYVLLSLQVLRWLLPSGALDGGSLSAYTIRKLQMEVGFHRNDLSVMLAGASWAVLATRGMFASLAARAGIALASLVVVAAQVLTGGRGGYLAWCVVGLTIGLIRWRRYLLLAPLLVMVLVTLVPGAVERALEGVRTTPEAGQEGVDVNEFTAGRNIIWPAVLAKVWEAPLAGYGRAAMERTGITAWLMASEDEALIEHPHNAYLEMLLDSGFLGLGVVLALYGTLVATALTVLRDRESPVVSAVGAVALALVLAQLTGSLTGQSFWPTEATAGMWCAAGLLLRVSVERSRRESRAGSPQAVRGSGDGAAVSIRPRVVAAAVDGPPSGPGREWWRAPAPAERRAAAGLEFRISPGDRETAAAPRRPAGREALPGVGALPRNLQVPPGEAGR
jgi:hypothetical protein